jgi:trimethylamine--corrinoid protein Co-methyltransferase
MARRIMRGIEVSDDTLMLDLIDEIGPGGEFVSAVETARRCRIEIWTPTLLDRNSWINWQASDSLTMRDRIKMRLREILTHHEPPPLPKGVEDEIERILRAAEERDRRSGGKLYDQR